MSLSSLCVLWIAAFIRVDDLPISQSGLPKVLSFILKTVCTWILFLPHPYAPVTNRI